MTGLGYQLRKQRARRPLGRYTLVAIVYSLANDFCAREEMAEGLDFSTTPEASRPSSTT